MKKYLLSKEGCQQTFGKETIVPESFVSNTGITNAVAIPKEDLLLLQKKYDLYRMENMDVINNNTANVICDKRFTKLMDKRKNATLRNRIKNSSWNPWWFLWLVISAISFVLYMTVFQPQAKRESAFNEELKNSAIMYKNGTWKKVMYMAERPLLKINLDEYEQQQHARVIRDSLTKYIDSTKKYFAGEKQRITKEYDQKITQCKSSIIILRDSISTTIKKQAQKILSDASKKLKEESGKGQGSTYPMLVFEAEQKRATILLQSIDSISELVQKPYMLQLQQLESASRNAHDSLIQTMNNTVSSIEKQLPVVKAMKYDLDHYEEYIKTNGDDLSAISKWVSIITLCIFIICLGILVVSLPKSKVSESEKYSHKNLEIMAFGGNDTGDKGRCNIIFHNLTTSTMEKAVSVRVRYSWNALVHSQSWEFKEPLLEHEKLTQEQMDNAFQPIFYVIEGDIAIIYSGLDKQVSEEEKETGSKPVVL